jgi:glycosyltransferase involved in cell wall biosynthesis
MIGQRKLIAKQRNSAGEHLREPAASSQAADDLLARADLARDTKQWAAASALYGEYLELVPDDAPIWVQRGNCAKEAGEYDAALVSYQAAIDLAPKESDHHLQMGHLYKLMKRRDEANASYRRALQLDPENSFAFDELAAAGMLKLAHKIAKQNGIGPLAKQVLVFDVSDLVFYIGHHAHLTGIQRVQCSIILSIVKGEMVPREAIEFVSYDRVLGQFRLIKKTQFLDLLDDLTLPGDERIVPFDQEQAKVGVLFPDAPLKVKLGKASGTLVLLGAAWVIPDYARIVVNLKRQFGWRFAMLFHDFIPVYARETCDQGTAEVFAAFMAQIMELVDEALCNSQNTANDLMRYCAEMDLVAPPVTVTRLGSGFAEIFSDAVPTADLKLDGSLDDEPYVLFVSTIEGRKNHDLALRIWRKLIAEGVKVPRLVCVGRLGWRSENFLHALIATNNLGGKVQILEDVSDAELQQLYNGCLFTIYPSLYEGWGLPVSESLSHGKICVTTRAASLPEVAADLGAYIPLDDLNEAAAIVRKLIENDEFRSDFEARIKSDYKPDSWRDVAQRVVDACAARQSEASRSQYPLLEFGVEYALRNPRTSTHGAMGQRMKQIITEARQGIILGKPVLQRHIHDVLLMRDDDWHEAEAWGCWTKGYSAKLEFAISPDHIKPQEKLLVYAALTVPGGGELGEIEVRLGKSASPPVTRAIKTERQIIAVGFHINTSTLLPNGMVPVQLNFILHPHSGAKSPPPIPGDSRLIGFGLRSLLIIPESEIETRQEITERIIFG